MRRSRVRLLAPGRKLWHDLGTGECAYCALWPAVAGHLCVAGSVALADNSIRLEIRFSDAVLTPGEVQHIEVWAYTDPPAGKQFIHPTYGNKISQGFGASGFDLQSITQGETGTFSEFLPSNPELSIYDPGAPAHGGVFGIKAQGHPCVFGFNPSVLLLWSATWTPEDYSARTVAFETATWKSAIAANHDFCYLPWPSEDSNASFKVVPAPGAVHAFAFAALAAFSRRRR